MTSTPATSRITSRGAKLSRYGESFQARLHVTDHWPVPSHQLHSDHSRVLHALFPGIGFKKLLPKLTAKLAEFRSVSQKISVPPFVYPVPNESNEIISQAWLWPRVGQFFRPYDVVLAETGTSGFGMIDVPMPKGATLITQVLWGSIGYTVGALLGAACAARDRQLGRTILFVGDGSL